VFNNPLSYTDPSGYFVQKVIDYIFGHNCNNPGRGCCSMGTPLCQSRFQGFINSIVSFLGSGGGDGGGFGGFSVGWGPGVGSFGNNSGGPSVGTVSWRGGGGGTSSPPPTLQQQPQGIVTQWSPSSANVWGVGYIGSYATYFTDPKQAYDYMWTNSFDKDGNPIRETSAWILKNGHIIVLPYSHNTLTKSYNCALRVRSKNGIYDRVNFNGRWYKISSHAHTHPSQIDFAPSGSPGDPRGDYKMYDRLNLSPQNPMFILHDGVIRSVWINRVGRWDSRNLGTW